MFKKLTKSIKGLAAGLCFVAVAGLSVSATPGIFQELEERLDGSVLEAVSILVDSLHQGTIALELESQDWRGNDERFRFQLHLSEPTQEYGFSMSIYDRFDDFELDLLVNSERVAARSSEVGDLFWGLYLNDLTTQTADALLSVVNDWNVRDLIDIATFAQRVFEAGEVVTPEPMDILALVAQFAQELNTQTQAVTINGQAATRTQATISMPALVGLYNGVMNQIFPGPHTAATQALFAMDPFLLAMLDANANGHPGFVVAAYTAQNGRLLRVSLEYSDQYLMWPHSAGQYAYFTLSYALDFGASALDTWTLEFEENHSRWGLTQVNATWDIAQQNGYRVDTFKLYDTWERSSGEIATDTLQLDVSWNSATGRLYLEGRETFGNHEFYGSFEGTLKINDISFVLQVADEDVPISVVVFATVGTAVPDAEFLNVLDPANVEKLLDLFIPAWSPTPVSAAQTMPVPVAPYGQLRPLPPPTAVQEAPPAPYQPAEPYVAQEAPTVQELVEEYGYDYDFVAYEPAQYGANFAVVANANYLYIRTGPGVDYVAFNHLVAGDVVSVLETRGNWVRVYTHRGTGWVYSAYLVEFV